MCSDRDRAARNCGNRLGLGEDARAVEAYTEEVRRELKEKKAQKVFGLGGIRLYECPMSYIDESTASTMRLVFLADETGHLLHGGGLGAQPYWFIEAMEIYRAEKARLTSAKRKNDS